MRESHRTRAPHYRRLRLEQIEPRLLLAIGFADISAGLTGVYQSSAAWGDYDNDGDLDVLLTGRVGGGNYVSKVYQNQGNGSFSDISAGLPGVDAGAVAWGDYDNDGDLDIVLTGATQTALISRVYQNQGTGGFSDISAGLTGVYSGAVDWGDYDNDGDLDLLLTGGTADGRVSQVYENQGNNSFSDISAGLTGVYRGSVEWGDYDNDGDLDILLAGWDNFGDNSQVYQNQGNGSFSDIHAALDNVSVGAVAWGDYDNDGDLDILLAGFSGGNIISRVFQNQGDGSFSNISADLIGIFVGSAAWGDYDNDGDLDILISGKNSNNIPLSLVYQNQGNGTFSDISVGLTGVYFSSVAWGDYDSDGDLDILIAGRDIGGISHSQVYRNAGGLANSAPAAPTSLAIAINGPTSATLSWAAAADTQTAEAGLSYNLRVGTTPGGSDVRAPMAFTSSGLRKIEARGLIQGTSWSLEDLTPGTTYYWSVQAIDTELAGGPFAVEGSFIMQFADAGAGLTDVRFSSVAWGDYDSDGDLDALVTGSASSNRISKVYQNQGSGSFSDISAGLAGVEFGSAAWGDYDNDGDLDILLTGSMGNLISQVYRNESGSFSDISAGLTGVFLSSVAWGDYDNDGDLDILLTGRAAGGRTSQVYRNESGSFSDISAGLIGVYQSSVAWGDYDGDGDLDILLTGQDNSSTRILKVYQNQGGGGFSDVSTGLTAVVGGSAAWGDYDNDGDLDILLTGTDSSDVLISKVYRNQSGSFSDISAGLTGVTNGSVAWGDYDNDGDLDILLTGTTGVAGKISRVYRNQGGGFSDISAALTGVYFSSVAWGDYDNDGDLDILLTGQDNGGNRVTRLYQNAVSTANSVPGAPGNLAAAVDNSNFTSVTLSWTAPADTETAAGGLSYNLRVGSTPGGSDVLGPMAFDSTNGLRKIAARGPIQGTHWTLDNLTRGATYYWSVQAIDTALAGGPFAAEGSFFVPEFDFGDAPSAAQSGFAASYPTLLADDGARHVPGSGLFLGAAVDGEADGLPLPGASGDDSDGTDDEDGVLLPTALVAGLGGRATVTASAPGKLDAWIDFNRDGDWNDAGEQIAAGLPLAAGANSVTFSTPAMALAGETYARFRLSSAGGLTPIGESPDGEVEDHAVMVTVPADGSAQVVDDPLNPGHNVLIVAGTEAQDKISTKGLKGDMVRVTVNKAKQSFASFDFERMVFFAKGGDDSVKLDEKLAINALVDAGGGKDTVKGGGGHNVLVGGPGKDKLTGGPLGDVLIGGSDADKLAGGKGKVPPGDSDLLIGGSTAYDALDAALQAILAEWISADAYLARVGNLRGSGTTPLAGTAVIADSASDTLTGGVDLDWFIAGGEDTLKDRAPDEQADIDGVPQSLTTKLASPSRLASSTAIGVTLPQSVRTSAASLPAKIFLSSPTETWIGQPVHRRRR